MNTRQENMYFIKKFCIKNKSVKKNGIQPYTFQKFVLYKGNPYNVQCLKRHP